MPSVRISVCICTMDRPAELARCLGSIMAGEVLPAEIVVADDSRETETRDLCRNWPLVRYVQGPRRGQGPNRQAGAAACRAAAVSFVDDDAVMSPPFLRIMGDRAATADWHTIFTGDLWEGGQRLTPSNMTFWGHFGAAVGSRPRENVIFNSNLFPRQVFDEVRFDPRIRYGYEDSDFCARAIRRGYRIEYVPEACNEHYPSDINRASSYAEREWARYYTSMKRYFLVQHSLTRGVAFAVLAPLQAAGSAARQARWQMLARVPADYLRAVSNFTRLLLEREGEPSASTADGKDTELKQLSDKSGLKV